MSLDMSALTPRMRSAKKPGESLYCCSVTTSTGVPYSRPTSMSHGALQVRLLALCVQVHEDAGQALCISVP